MSETKARLRAKYEDRMVETDMRGIIDEINRLGPVVIVKVVTAGTEVAVAHGCGKAPSSALLALATYASYGLPAPEAGSDIMGLGIVYPTATAWTATHAYLTATIKGYYAVHFRR